MHPRCLRLNSPARHYGVLATMVMVLSVLGVAMATPAGADAGDIGTEGGPFVEVGRPTETKAQSKVWFHDGAWWSIQATQDGVDSQNRPVASTFIYRLDDATETWVRGARIENRGTAKADVVAAGDALYIATHKTDRNTGVTETVPNNRTLMFRFAYDAGTKAYTATGPAVAMSAFEMFSITIDRTPTGELWAAWIMGDGAPTPTYRVYTQSSTDDGATWSAPAPLATPAAVTTKYDIASIAAFADQVGVMWSDQLPTPANDGFFFATHPANPAVGTFSAPETAYAGTNVGDDHVNLKVAGGKVYAAVKTSDDTGSSPLIVLLQRADDGSWTRRTAWTGRTNVTRPILQINETTATARLWATGPLVAGEHGEEGGAIFTKAVPLDSGTFDPNAAGDPAMFRNGARINDVTGSKAPVTQATGTVVLASDGSTNRYWHSRIPAVVTPSVPPGNEYVAITPCRVVDTRSAQSDGPLVVRQPRTFQIKGSGPAFAAQGGRSNGCAIPAGATAVEASVTATVPGGTGFFRAWPSGTNPPQATFVNYTKDQGTTNTGSLSLGDGPRELTAQNYGAPTNFVIDIQGYFMAPGTTDAKVYVPLTPCRLADTRSAGAGGALVPDEQRQFQISGSSPTFATQGGTPGGCNVPAGAKAVEASVTATQPTANGFFRAWPEGQAMPNATFANFTKNQGTTNTGAITLGTLGADGKDLSVRNYSARTHYVIDVQGYYIDSNAVPSDRTAVRYVPGVPCRLVDTRSTGAGGSFGNRELRRYQIAGDGAPIAAQGGKTGGCGVPVGAAAVEASVTAVTPNGDGFFRAWPNGAAEPNATIVNFTKGQGTTNTGATSLAGSAPELATRNFSGSAQYVIDVQGYFVAAP